MNAFVQAIALTRQARPTLFHSVSHRATPPGNVKTYPQAPAHRADPYRAAQRLLEPAVQPPARRPALREQIARLAVDSGCRLTPADIAVTSGCQEAPSCAIRALCAPGDIVAIASPSFHGMMQVLHMKYIGSGATATQPQLAVAEFIAAGHYQPHLRRMRKQYQRNRDLMTEWVSRYFPAGTRVSKPQGGFTLWVELPEEVDCYALNRFLEAQDVQVANGSIFSAAGKYRHCLRLNFATPSSRKIEMAVAKVGQAIGQLLPG